MAQCNWQPKERLIIPTGIGVSLNDNQPWYSVLASIHCMNPGNGITAFCISKYPIKHWSVRNSDLLYIHKRRGGVVQECNSNMIPRHKRVGRWLGSLGHQSSVACIEFFPFRRRVVKGLRILQMLMLSSSRTGQPSTASPLQLIAFSVHWSLPHQSQQKLELSP